MDDTGAAPPGNRFGRVYSYGHRNVQGLAQDRNGQVWASELGQNAQDEVNPLSVGGNYGWPLVEGRGGDGRFVDPAWTWRPEEASPSGPDRQGRQPVRRGPAGTARVAAALQRHHRQQRHADVPGHLRPGARGHAETRRTGRCG